jgi:protein subunit release factor A
VATTDFGEEDKMDEDDYRNPNPDDATEVAAIELCRIVGLLPWVCGDQPGFQGDYNMNWARHEIDHALAVRSAMLKAGLLNPNASPEFEYPDGPRVRIEIAAGSGGIEPQDFAIMIRRMYLRWAERNGIKVEPGKSPGETLEFSGERAAMLLSENGVHRMVRISPHDRENRRHTSFVAVKAARLVNRWAVLSVNRRESHLWGNQIRSYVFDPYKMVKDLRTGVQREDVDNVLDGDIDDFLLAAKAAGFPHNHDENGPTPEAAVMD